MMLYQIRFIYHCGREWIRWIYQSLREIQYSLSDFSRLEKIILSLGISDIILYTYSPFSGYMYWADRAPRSLSDAKTKSIFEIHHLTLKGWGCLTRPFYQKGWDDCALFPQFYIQMVYKAPLSFTLRNKIWVVSEKISLLV